MTDDRLQHLRDVAPLLWPAPLRLHSDPAGGAAVSSATHAAYVVLPNGRRPRLLVPRQRRAAAGAVRRYGVGRGRAARWQAALLAAGMSTGIAPLLLRDRMTVLGSPGELEPIETHLSAVLGRPVLLSMYLGAPRANRKPVLQVLTPRGDTIAFAKVGVDPLTCRLIRAETAALTALADAGLRRVAVAEVLHSGEWQGSELLVQSALPVGGRGGRPDRSLLLAAQAEVASIGASPAAPLGDSPYWAGLASRLAALPAGPEVADLLELAGRVEGSFGGVALPFGAWHGDWTPWNTAARDGRLLVWDWERFSPGVPSGYDGLHWALQTDLVNRLADPRRSADRLLAHPPDLSAFALDPVQSRAAAAAYLMELAVRYVTDRQSEAGARLGDVRTWLVPALRAALPAPQRSAPARETRKALMSVSQLRRTPAVQRSAKTVSRSVGRLTSAHRVLPGFLIAGGQRCGTTSMFRVLRDHPAVLPPVLHKGVHYFDTDYDKGIDWYRAHFPLAATARAVERRHGVPAQAFESSPYYMFHPLAAERIAADLPGVKLVVLLRDPVERAYSAHAHELARGFEDQDFPTALDLEDDRLAGEVERLVADPGYRSHSHQHHAYVERGRYVVHLQRLERIFGRERIHVVDSSRFFTEPQPVYDGVLEFLGLPHTGYPRFEQHNARARSPLDEKTRARLDAHFAPYDDELARWLGSPVSWRRPAEREER